MGSLTIWPEKYLEWFVKLLSLISQHSPDIFQNKIEYFEQKKMHGDEKPKNQTHQTKCSATKRRRAELNMKQYENIADRKLDVTLTEVHLFGIISWISWHYRIRSLSVFFCNLRINKPPYQLQTPLYYSCSISAQPQPLMFARETDLFLCL